MLPARHRLRKSADFSAVFRGAGGSRSGSRLIVVHANSTDARAGHPPRVGLVVSKGVGNAVVRNRVKRRLRASMQTRIDQVPAGVDVVIRAKNELSGAPSVTLGQDLDTLLATVLRRVRSQEGH